MLLCLTVFIKGYSFKGNRPRYNYGTKLAEKSLLLELGDSRKYPYLYHGRLLGFPKGRGVLELEFQRNGGGGYLQLEIRRHGGNSQGGFLE